MVPQEPMLFEGSIRSNIDPSNEFSDEEVWFALKRCGLHEFVSELPEKLHAPIEVNSTNLSLGQKQVLCIVPAILRKSRILVFDESTSAMDSESDQKIQDVVKEQFPFSTVISVAHRLSTIASFDRVLVMDAGELKEFESPSKLLENPASHFYQLAKASGEFEKLVALTRKV
jgi:ABC-type multidrug transport system fused ATPase/permease subunit